MAKIPYSKPFLSYSDQLQQLKDRGLSIEDDAKALHLLEAISYYRLSGYWYPMLAEPKSNHTFKPGSTFDTGFKLYCFDRELRKLVAAEIEKIEVAIRAKMIHSLAEINGPFWYSNNNLFKNPTRVANSLNKFSDEYQKSDEQFINAFKAKYSDTLPPCWMLLEISSFGNLSHIYKNLKPSRQKRAIANHFGLDETTFQSWIHCIVYIRNICAHHTRLWNRTMSITPTIPLKPANVWLTITEVIDTQTGNTVSIHNKPYFLLSMIVYLLNVVNPKHTFKTKIRALLAKYPNVDVRAMGAPNKWEDEPLWA